MTRINAGIDQNAVKSLLAVSSADGVSIVVVWADPVTHALLIKNVGGSGTWYQDEIVATGQTGTSFSLLHTPSSVVFLYKNGQYLVSGASYDYTISGANITLQTSLLATDLLTATYS
jgi:hypothetical protein